MHLLLTSLFGGVLSGCGPRTPPPTAPPEGPTPPGPPGGAGGRPHALVAHERARQDYYYWLRDREDPATLEHLEAENQYFQAAFGHADGLRAALFDEMLGRIREADSDPPFPWGGWLYQERREEGRAYPLYVRRAAPDAPEQLLLDLNTLADEDDYLYLGGFAPSPDHSLLAYAIDRSGDELYTIRVLDLETGEHLPDVIEGAYYGLEWSASGEHLFYTTVDEAHRPWRLHRHRLGGDAEDALVYQEDDEAYWLELSKTRSERFLVVSLGSQVTTELRVIDADEPESSPRLVAPRRQGVEVYLAHQGERFLLLTNHEAVNFRLMEADLEDPEPASWRPLIAHREDVQLVGVDAFEERLVIWEREGGLPRLSVVDVEAQSARRVDFPEPVWGLEEVDANREYDARRFRFLYSSLTTPDTIIDLDLDSLEQEALKVKPVEGGFDSADYQSARIMARAADGAEVPVSLVWRADRRREGQPAPVLMTGYGAYGANYDVYFSSNRLSLLDRGVIFAIAHVRGGADLGRPWYEDGKLGRKRNTFTDFIACGEALVAGGWTLPSLLAAQGESAGGLLIGASVNLRPDLFQAAVAHVPFVDVLTTMADPSIPLTVVEWEEWGNPVDDPEAYAYMATYSPYDNVRAEADYPSLLVTAGLNDPRVGYWEPAKWVARMRHVADDGDGMLLLWTEMGAGHGGPSGRYGELEAIAREYAFVLESLGVGG